MLRIGFCVPKYFVIARVQRGIDVILFALNNAMFINIKALSSNNRFTRLNLLVRDEAKRDTNSAASTRMRELNKFFSIYRVRDD